jgi:hypothetical protein
VERRGGAGEAAGGAVWPAATRGWKGWGATGGRRGSRQVGPTCLREEKEERGGRRASGLLWAEFGDGPGVGRWVGFDFSFLFLFFFQIPFSNQFKIFIKSNLSHNFFQLFSNYF